jgi:flagellar basal body-associated protein FliL
MADDAKKRPEPDAKGGDGHEKPKGGGLLTKTPVLIGAAMLIEALVLFAGFKFLMGSSPAAAQGAELAEGHGGGEGGHGAEGGGHGEGGEGKPAGPVDKKKPVEMQLIAGRYINKAAGKAFIYDVAIYVVTRAEHEEAVKTKIKEREALIQDRVRTIIAQSDPDRLGGGSEPGLETLRRQVKYQLDEIVGDGMIDEVLVPRCIPFRTDL